MRLTHLSLTNFRNFARLETELPAGPTLLIGANAQGKTSLLEAIYYLASAASPHASSDRQLINFLALQAPAPFARIVAEIRRHDRPQRVEIRIVEEAPEPGQGSRLRKEVLINGVRRPARQLPAALNTVLFQPQDLQVVEGSPGERRRFLDEAISQGDPGYGEAAAQYSRVLAQRNALLKQIHEAGYGSNGDQLAFWDQQLAELGAAIIRGRALALRELEHFAETIHTDLTRGTERLRLDYLPSFDPQHASTGQLGLPIGAPVDHTAIPRESLHDGLLEVLHASREEEIARGITLVGPHRDDFRIRASGIDLTTYGSRGQNRTAILALKLAEIEWMRQRTGEWPVLLLDEVLAELDSDRRSSLLDRVDAAEQAILTSADLGLFGAAFRARATIWQISGGRLSPLGPA
jgi:DNA replication and repair protein RecF